MVKVLENARNKQQRKEIMQFQNPNPTYTENAMVYACRMAYRFGITSVPLYPFETISKNRKHPPTPSCCKRFQLWKRSENSQLTSTPISSAFQYILPWKHKKISPIYSKEPQVS